MNKGTRMIAFILVISVTTGLLGQAAARSTVRLGDKKASRVEEGKPEGKEGKKAVNEEDAAGGSKVWAAAKPAPIELGDGPVRATLEPLPKRGGDRAVGIPGRVEALGPSRRLYLVVRGLRAASPPGVLYGIYLDLSDNPTPDQLKAHKVGVLNFFNAVGQGQGNVAESKDTGFLSFDVTDVAKSLRTKGLLKDKPALTITPAGRPAASAKPVVVEITLVEK